VVGVDAGNAVTPSTGPPTSDGVLYILHMGDGTIPTVRNTCGGLDQLTWMACLPRHLTRRLTHTVRGGDEYIATHRHIRMHQPAPCNAHRNFFLESVSAELRYGRDSIEFPGIKMLDWRKNFWKINIPD